MDNELNRRIDVLISIRKHAERFPEPKNQIVRDIAERFQITCEEVMRRMAANAALYGMKPVA